MGRFWKDFRAQDDPRQRALAQGLIDFGSAFGSQVGTQGFGALAPSISYGAQGLSGTLAEERERERREEAARIAAERRAEENRREDLRWEHTMDEWERAKTEREKKAAERKAAAVAEQERKESMLKAIEEAEGPAAAKRASLMSPGAREKYYVRVTGDEEVAKAPTTKSFPDGSLRQWTGSEWKILQEKRGEPVKRARSMTPGQIRNEAQEAANREVGTWSQWRKERVGGTLGRFPGNVEEDIDMGELRGQYNQEWNESFERAMQGLSGQENSPRAGAGEPTSAGPDQDRNKKADEIAQQPIPPGLDYKTAFDGLKMTLAEGGAPEAEVQRILKIEEALRAQLPQEVLDSPRFLQVLRAEIARGKTAEEIIRDIMTAAGGG